MKKIFSAVAFFTIIFLSGFQAKAQYTITAAGLLSGGGFCLHGPCGLTSCPFGAIDTVKCIAQTRVFTSAYTAGLTVVTNWGDGYIDTTPVLSYSFS